MTPEVLRYAAFADPQHPGGGNPAGIVTDAAGLDEARMQRIAAEVGFAETAFLTGERRIRYFSPIAEVPFCGHATIATAVVLAERDGLGPRTFETPVGPVRIETARDPDGVVRAAFTSVAPRVEGIDPSVLARLLDLLGLEPGDLDPALPVRVAFAGNRHPVLVVRERAVFDGFAFDPAAVRALMDAEGWTGTVTVVHRVGDAVWEARNLFPVGAITEDPATGSAAASFGGYLRELGAVQPPATLRIHQGAHVGRPSLLQVDIPDAGGITVSGTATPL
ncbi:PhzF family phenazine biosynthesis isomerase [Microbacterium sp. 10M-3C3]|uniref:PhzF family phenazine biosynthesis protein n=1 Tax=Microbacterium sp. 10M-3C3 TaxID=2483401 RepID=UPI000F64127B|nr:PhzF family phenazine biosynthesis isomerase [Microbacterium sp. 10M-3C3]